MSLYAEQFEEMLGQAVTVQLDSGDQIELTLDTVIRAGSPSSAGEDEAPKHRAFTLDLSGPPAPVIAPLTYPVLFPGMEPMHLFISAHGQDEAHIFYSIVVN